MYQRSFRGGLGLLAAGLVASAANAQDGLPSQAEMWRVIQEQARQLNEQRQEIEALKRAALPQFRDAIITPPPVGGGEFDAGRDRAAVDAQRAAASAEVQRIAAAQEAQRATAAALEAQRSATQA